MGFLAAALDLILLGVLAEAVVLGFVLRRKARALIAPLLLFLGSGFCLIAALRLELGGAGEAAVGALLLVGGLLHGACLWRAWAAWGRAR